MFTEDPNTEKYSASEQCLRYIYQPHLVLHQLLELPENAAVVLEKDGNLDLLDKDGSKFLVSLKHKAAGDRLTNFWKSVRI